MRERAGFKDSTQTPLIHLIQEHLQSGSPSSFNAQGAGNEKKSI